MSSFSFLKSLHIFDLVVMASVFGLVLATWLVVLLVWSVRRSVRSHKVEKRLGLIDDERQSSERRVLRLWHDGKEAVTEVQGTDRKPTYRERLARLSHEAELKVPLQALIPGFAGILILAFFGLLLVTHSPLPGFGLSVAVIGGFGTYLKGRIRRRLARFETQFVDALDLAARSLRAGHPLMGAFRLISEEIPEPVSTVFGEICQQQDLGVSTVDALRRVADESPSQDLKLFATSVIIQMRSGGNLADMMERIAFVIRDRIRLSRRVRVLTAQTQLSKRILIALPILMFLLLNVINHKYMEMFYTTTHGQLLLAGAGTGILLGAWMMNRLAVLRY
jgi:tight adherence protein B